MKSTTVKSARRLVLLAACGVGAIGSGDLARGALVVEDGFEVATHPTQSRTDFVAPGRPFYTRQDAAGTTAAIVNDTGVGGLGSRALSVADIDTNTGTSGVTIAPLATAYALNNVNDRLTLAFRFRYTTNATAPAGGNNFRFGFFSSNGSAVSGDNAPESDTDIGYYAAIGSGGTAAGTTSLFFEETGGIGNILGGTDRTSITASGTAGTGLNDNAVHTASLTLTRTSASAIGLSLVVDGGTPITGSDTGTLRTTFDEIAFGGAFNTTGNAFILDDVTVDYVPEPAAAGLAALGLPLLARRRATRARA